jgi:hypothetical protein
MIFLDNTVYLGKAAAGAGGGSAKPKYVPELPETGEEGVLYLVPTEFTRDGYQIFQEFTWYNNEWKAIGAYDVGIDATNVVYQQSFDASTGTWTVKVG